MPTNFAEKIEEIVELLRHNPNLILYGPPGTGKTYTAKAVAEFIILKRLRFLNIMITHWDNFWDNIPFSNDLRRYNNEFLDEEEIELGYAFYGKNLFDADLVSKFNKELSISPTIFVQWNQKKAWIGKVKKLEIIGDRVKFIPEIYRELSDKEAKAVIEYLPPSIKEKGKNSGWYIFDLSDKNSLNDILDLLLLLIDFMNYWHIVQFHPSYNYDDFVVGIEARTKDGQVVFEKVWRTLGEMSRRALVSMALPEKFGEYLNSNKENNNDEIYKEAKEKWLEASKDEREKMIENAPPFVLIIDEINRANLPAVLGELIYALEYRGEPVNIMYGEELIIPPNLYIIGTMNTADRSAGRIDYAIRRRFTFYPMHAKIEEHLVKKGIIPAYGKGLMEAVNEFIEKKISPEYDPEDIKIGHTYFMSRKDADEEKRKEIAYKFLYQVVPLLYEYIKDGLVHAEREEKEENDKKRFKGYKIELEINIETGNKEQKTYYLRGGRLYKDENSEVKIENLWFVNEIPQQTDSNDRNRQEKSD